MLIDILQSLVGTFLWLITVVLSAITLVIPDDIGNAINTGVGYTRYFRGILPMDTVWQAISFLISFFTALGGTKLAIWLLGKRDPLPLMGGGFKADISNRTVLLKRGNIVNLRDR